MTLEVAVSVIVSTRNRAHYLPDALRALAAQECEPAFEVVLIDNASTDDTPSVLDAWCRSDPRFVTAQEPRLGQSYGKNAGIRLARAPLLLFTDDDIIADPQWIQSYVAFFARRSEGAMLAGGPCLPIPHDLGPWPSWLSEPALADVALLHHRNERTLRPLEYVWGNNMAVPRRLFEQYGLWNEALGHRGEQRGTFEDTEFQDRVRQAGGVVWFTPLPSVRHRVPRQTITPRQISSTAFARGRNDFWMEHIPAWREVGRVPRRNALVTFLRLAVHLSRWGFWVMAFRLAPKKSVFERARRAAFTSGRTLDSVRAGRQSERLYLAMGRFAFRVRGLFLRLSPDVG